MDRRWLLAGVLALGLALTSEARAQDTATPSPSSTSPSTGSADEARDAEGRGLFEAGRAAFADGRYEDAVGYFDRAHSLSHRPELLYNIGSAYDRLRRDAEALAAFEQYVQALPDAPNVREVEARMRVLREAIAAHETADPDPTETTLPDSAAATTTATTTATATATPTPAPSDAPSDDHGDDVAGAWWLWTIIGAVVVGGVVAGVVLGTQASGTTYPAYDRGTEGTTMTLTVTF